MKREMAHVQIVGLKSQLEPAIQTLHQLGCVQVEDVAEVDSVSARPLELLTDVVGRREKLSHLVARLEGILAALGSPGQETALSALPPTTTCIDEAEAGLAEVGPQVQALVSRQEALEAEQASLPRYVTTLRKLLPVVPPSAQKPENATVSVLVGRSHRWVLDTLNEEVVKLTAGKAETAVGSLDEATLAMMIVVPRAFLADVERLLGREDISRLRLPQSVDDQPLDRALQTLSRRLATIPQELTHIQTELDTLAATWQPQLQRWLACLRDRLDEISILSNLGETEQTFVIVGWLAAVDVPTVEQALAEAIGEPVIVERLPLNQADQTRMPVVLVNPALARPFESLVRLYRWPRFWDADPTLLVAFFMPMFFGMILGDIGYGAVLLLLCLVALRRFREPGIKRDIVRILAFGALWAILFGFLYGELFGSVGEAVGLHPILFDRANATAMTSLLAFALVVGVVHVTLGVLIGVWVAAREGNRHLLLERGGTLVGLAGLFLLVSALAEWLPLAFKTPGTLVMLIGVMLLSASHGWVGVLLGPIEFVGVLGNILSYLRIAAVGLASVYVARLANELAGVIGVVVVGLIVALLIHALNLVLGVFSPSIHSLRLQYVEFFRKFYEGGGGPFVPFRSRL
ncbi:MAG TPA: V-type ATPase 116kDa subunit family protein [Anaerolineae bacterium]